MELVALGLGLLLTLFWALRELRNEQLRNKQIDRLKVVINQNETESRLRDEEELAAADVAATIGFLNSLHKDRKNTN